MRPRHTCMMVNSSENGVTGDAPWTHAQGSLRPGMQYSLRVCGAKRRARAWHLRVILEARRRRRAARLPCAAPRAAGPLPQPGRALRRSAGLRARFATRARQPPRARRLRMAECALARATAAAATAVAAAAAAAAVAAAATVTAVRCCGGCACRPLPLHGCCAGLSWLRVHCAGAEGGGRGRGRATALIIAVRQQRAPLAQRGRRMRRRGPRRRQWRSPCPQRPDGTGVCAARLPPGPAGSPAPRAPAPGGAPLAGPRVPGGPQRRARRRCARVLAVREAAEQPHMASCPLRMLVHWARLG